MQLLALTGQRRREIAALKWEWINQKGKTITLPSHVPKNGLFLDLPLVATLLLVRKELLDGIHNPTVGDRMLAESAVMAYRNLLRIQGWIGSLCLVVERELFGQRSLDDVLGSTEAAEVNVQVERLEQILLPALDRCHRMLIRALDRLEARKSGKPSASISIGSAGQVNLASNVQNLNA